MNEFFQQILWPAKIIAWIWAFASCMGVLLFAAKIFISIFESKKI